MPVTGSRVATQAAWTLRTAGSPGYGVFRTADDRWLALGVLGEARLWDGICRGLGLDDLVGLSFAERVTRQAEVDAAIAAAIARLDLDDAVARLQAEGAPVTPVLSPEEATVHPQLAARGFHVDSDAGVVAGLPVRFGGRGATARSTTAAGLPTHVPAPDEHPTGFTPR